MSERAEALSEAQRYQVNDLLAKLGGLADAHARAVGAFSGDKTGND